MLVSAYGDESSDERQERVFAVACVAAPEEVWREVEAAWVERTGGQEFSAARCESEYAHDPDPAKHRENLLLYADLSNLIGQSYLVGRGVALDLASHRECFPGVPDDVGYYKCFTDTVTHMLNYIEAFNERGQGEEQALLEFTFDHRAESEHNAGQLYQSFLNSPEWAHKNRFLSSKVSFDSSANPRVQVADLVARETMKALDNRIGPVERPERKSILALGKNGEFRFDLLGREYCESWLAKATELEAQAGIEISDYEKWLADNRLGVDNWSNRFKFLVYSNNKDQLA